MGAPEWRGPLLSVSLPVSGRTVHYYGRLSWREQSAIWDKRQTPHRAQIAGLYYCLRDADGGWPLTTGDKRRLTEDQLLDEWSPEDIEAAWLALERAIESSETNPAGKG